MRSAERLHATRVAVTVTAGRARLGPTALACAAVLAALAGCDTIGVHFRRAPSAPASAASSANASASAPASPSTTASTTAPPVAAKPVSTAPIPAATQRAYDDALAALRAGHAADAERGLRALAQSDPDLAGPHANLGLIAREAGRLPEAIIELEQATQLDPRQPVMWNQLGIAYRQHGDFAKARDAYGNALAIDPDYATAVLNLGVLDDLYLGDSAKALELYTRYLALTPAGDPAVAKWVVDLKNRRPATAASAPAPVAPTPAAAPKEKS